MASFLDITLLNEFSNIFVILFVFTATYGVLMFRKPLGGDKGVNALLAFAVSLIFIFSQDAIDIIKDTVPWFIILMIALVFVLIVTQSVGSSLPEPLLKSLGTWILVISIFILLLNISLRIGQEAGPFLGNGNQTVDPDNVQAGEGGDVATGSYAQNLGATLFHPKVLGMMLVLLVGVFAVLWIGYVGPPV